eukprot:scaffold20.g7627.t1
MEEAAAVAPAVQEETAEFVLAVQEPEEPMAVAHPRSKRRQKKCSGTAALEPQAGSRRRSVNQLAALLAGAALAAGLAVAAWHRARKCRSGVQRAAVRPEKVFTTLVHLAQPALPPAHSPLLAGSTFAVSDRVDIQSVGTRFGSAAWKSGSQPAQHSSPVVDVLCSHGARCKAVAASEPLGLGPLLMPSLGGVPNPAGRGFHHGGGEYGAAVAVAAGLADLALAVDELGSARVSAACCGAYALRTTAGVLPLEGAAAASHSLAVPALLAAAPDALLRAGQALRLPTAGRGEVAHYLVAEDFFAACGPELQAALPAVVAGVKRWAGLEQAQGLSLCDWVFHRVQSLRSFMPPPPAPPEQVPGANGRPRRRTAEVLAALAAAAEAVRQWEFSQLHGDWVAAQPPGTLDSQVVAFWQQARQVPAERYQAARSVASELAGAMRGALAEGYVFVLPTTPGPAPREGDAEAQAAFRRGCAEFAALAALSGVPQAVLPLPRAGELPLSVSLLSLHKRELTLLQAAAKLGPMLAEEMAELGGSARARPAADRAAGGCGPSSAAAAPRQRKPAAGQEPAEARAKACKAEGNAAFKAGKYDVAVRHYSAAIQLHPRAAVYYANRAMALLKLGRYSDAEADCDAALGLELSVKSLLRRGSARLAQGNAAGAHADFRHALALEPNNRQAREELAGIAAMEGAAGGSAGF